MHACGHDGHTAYLLVLADCLIQLKSSFQVTMKIIHQHAEETPPGGAKSIVESGLLDDLDAVYGVHLFPTNPAGVVGYRSGFAMAERHILNWLLMVLVVMDHHHIWQMMRLLQGHTLYSNPNCH